MESNNQSREYDDEIDLIELFKKIWKWKWLIIGLTIVVTVSTFFYVKSKPDTYTVSADLVIGKIANYSIDNISSIKKQVRDVFVRKKWAGFSLDKDKDKDKDKVEFNLNKKGKYLTVSYKTKSAEDSFKVINRVIVIILKRHESLYDEAVVKINKSISFSKNKSVIHPSYVLKSYNYKSYLLNKIEIPENADSKKLKLKIAIAFITSMFMSVFIVFFLDFLFTYKKKLDNK